MTQPPPAPSDDDRPRCVLPDKVKLLGQALAPVAEDLRRALKRRVRRSGEPFEAPKDVVRVTGELVRLIQGLGERQDALARWLAAPGEASPLEAGRIVGRFEQQVAGFVNIHRELLRAPDGPHSGGERQLLVGVFRHHLNDISAWMDRLIAMIADPRAELERQGLPVAQGTVISLPLTLSHPPQMEQLLRVARHCWVHARTTPSRQAPPPGLPPLEHRAPPGDPGLLQRLGALVFGFGVAQALSDRERKD